MPKMEPVNRHHVKTVVRVLRVQLFDSHVHPGSQLQPFLLAAVHKFVSLSITVGLPELDFHKNQRIPLSRHNIQFTTANTVVSRQNPIALHPEPAG